MRVLTMAVVAMMLVAPSTAPAQARPVAGQKVVLITGATSGLGREVALRLADAGAHVIVHGRDSVRGREVIDSVSRAGKGSARFYAADLASNGDIRRFAAEILRDYPRLDVLVNNAGIGDSKGVRTLTAEGVEIQWQVNYLSGVLLTHLLLPRLVASAPSRIVNVSSLSAAAIDFDDVMMAKGFSEDRAYGQSKLAQILFTLDLAPRLAPQGVSVNALHPATLMPTGMVLRGGYTPRSTIDEGARAVLQLVQASDVGTGQFYRGLTLARAHAQAYDESARARLREVSERLVGIR